jgi:tetratricopeptide (TPR) repeat protein
MHHPFFRKIARAMTPAAVLRELHAKAMALAGLSLPLEVRAFHMQQAGDAFSALLSLESIGERARNRDDLDTALEAFRIGFELARRSAGDPDLDDPMHAVALFGWKLGESLSQMGRHGEADGILSESLDFASSIEQRARLVFSQARVARLRGNTQRASRLAREAMDLASQRDVKLAATFEKEARRWQS